MFINIWWKRTIGNARNFLKNVLLSHTVNGSYHTKYISLTNQKCMIQPTRINWHPKEYSQEFYYYPFAFKSDKSAESCNTLNELSNKVFVLVNLNVDSIEKNIIQINGGITINVSVSVKNIMYVKKNYI